MKSKKFKLSAIVFYSVITALALILPNMAFANPFPDTGQTKCYNNTQEIPCSQPGEPFYGQDAQYGPNLQSFTDLGNGVVRDNVTGLEWQQATAPSTYTWQQALDYCAALSLGGKDDWRLPTIKELSTLVDSSIPLPGPTINTSYFPDTVVSDYWSSTTVAYNPGYSWDVSFNSGYVYTPYDINSNGYLYVRAVRGGQSNNSFVDNNDGTISDINTGLMWQKATAPGTYTWEQALTYCENLTLPAGGYSDWRLPNRNELQSIVDYSRFKPAIDTTYFPGTSYQNPYWSSATNAGSPNSAWCVVLYGGHVGYGPVNDYFYKSASPFHFSVRAVRGGACEIPTAITLASFDVQPANSRVTLTWSTATEIDNAGFNIYRAESENGNYTKINNSLIPANGTSTQGASYEYTDTGLQNRKTYYYKLEDIDLSGKNTIHGPVSATPRLIYGIGK